MYTKHFPTTKCLSCNKLLAIHDADSPRTVVKTCLSCGFSACSKCLLGWVCPSCGARLTFAKVEGPHIAFMWDDDPPYYMVD